MARQMFQFRFQPFDLQFLVASSHFFSEVVQILRLKSHYLLTSVFAQFVLFFESQANLIFFDFPFSYLKSVPSVLSL